MSEDSRLLNVSVFKEIAREELKNCLQKYDGTKAIIWDEKILGIIELIADFAFLRQYGVIQMLHLRKDRLPLIRAEHVVYFVRKKPSLMKLIVDNLREEIKKTTKNHDYHILFMPCKSWLCEKILEDENVSSIISSVSEYPVEILPIDDDVLSMQMIDSLKELFVEKDYSCLLHVARAIIHIQLRFGIIRDIYGQGSCAKRVTELLSKLKNEMSLNESHVVPQIHSLLILDRSIDFITPLMNQMTYEGLCDEIFGTNNGLKKKVLEHYSREILQTYGYSNLEFLHNLELAGLIKVRNTLLNKPYNMLKKQFRLTRVKTEPDNDLTYVFNGYAPLSARIVESFLKSRWITMSETLKVLPGSTFEYHQQIPLELRRHRSSITSVTSSRSNIVPNEEPRVILVFFIGGVTFAEISALRLLAQKRNLNVELLIATTQILNGKTLVEALR
ncbi:vacuolar protein sorting-associated protein 33A-like isoform X2 [Brevipalpus obovatus]|uniref:vacuolar protein sorting-associated protein 33A-like isoform X2 n=1 Tax=Brevipalpus obovatus TaxID=246614 RepID=UPI003D9F543B